MGALRDQRVTMDAKGRVALPRALREAAGLTKTSDLVAAIEPDGSIRLEKISARISRMQDKFARYAPPDGLASDELMAERKRDAARE